MHNPQITVLMPAYNAGKYIREAITSVLEQSFADFELLIVNDGSTDDTADIINSFNDERIVVLGQENKGVAAALNKGLRHARAPYIARFDADDVCYPYRLQVQYDFITSHPYYSIIGSGVDYTDVNGDLIFTWQPDALSHNQIRQLSYRICPFIHSSVFYKRDTVLNAGGYNELAYTFEDHFLWAGILKHEKAFNLNQPLIKVRLNAESVTIDEKWRTGKFRQIKYNALRKGSITEAEGRRLSEIGNKQLSPRIKKGAYYALLGKKYLWNNYQPEKARENLLKTLSISPLHLKNYFLLLMSFLPERMLMNLYQLGKRNFRLADAELPTAVLNQNELNYGS
ncbi:glycosyltransferase [Mucilaginibacter rubeus]|uniref:Glycosyltransferase n=1 Tax=Mucilaginibacter rubeus TaxID=2027860 RepID=A0AAE6JEZ0_9SPHI|nr:MULTISPECIES: glycosyltransferase [Mucilaginibacter]QEM04346.1 glycosyltransferase [Mucilaginibacter rubeus]QEM16945.1 glycosyltransferase [Mucilaginibacter gossypii]QTE46563.1 glycosyltransferase [Mucilaginibacter rubeus]QTE53160.1 glycosyltransferase [Mucilaginibacter rubeus]QTE62294.1 glycosyltransferase [Mucilaginibacter rubeus]